MTNHKQAAIEAGARRLLHNANSFGAPKKKFRTLPEEVQKEWLKHSSEVLEAALPHLREMIAEEIRADIAARTWYEPIQLGMKRAANIAEEGPQQ